MAPCLCDVSLCTFCDVARVAEYSRSGLSASVSLPSVGAGVGGPETFDDMEADCG